MRPEKLIGESLHVEAHLVHGARQIPSCLACSFLAAVKAWAGLASNQCDARNEFTVEKSREIVELLGKYGMKPPFI